MFCFRDGNIQDQAVEIGRLALEETDYRDRTVFLGGPDRVAQAVPSHYIENDVDALSVGQFKDGSSSRRWRLRGRLPR